MNGKSLPSEFLFSHAHPVGHHQDYSRLLGADKVGFGIKVEDGDQVSLGVAGNQTIARTVAVLSQQPLLPCFAFR
jgi:hypothetical protein